MRHGERANAREHERETVSSIYDGPLGIRHSLGRCGPRLQRGPHLTGPPPSRTVGVILDGNAKRSELGTDSIRSGVVSSRSGGLPCLNQTLDPYRASVFF